MNPTSMFDRLEGLKQCARPAHLNQRFSKPPLAVCSRMEAYFDYMVYSATVCLIKKSRHFKIEFFTAMG